MLEIVVAILYFFNKLFFLLEKKSGWLIGILASALATGYFLTIQLYIFFSLEVACLLIMILGWAGSKKTTALSYMVYGAVILVMIYLLINIDESGPLEFITSICFIIAFLSLANHKWHYGWSFMGVSHALMFYVTMLKEQYFFSVMQALSVIICIVALTRTPKQIDYSSKQL